MKYKTQEPEENKSNGIVELIQFEYNRMCLLQSGILYAHMNGIETSKRFFSRAYDACRQCIQDLLEFLYVNSEEIPEFKVPEIQYFEKIEEPYEALSEAEEEYFEKANTLFAQAVEDKDVKMIVALYKIIKVPHIMCRAYEAIKNNQDPNTVCNNKTWNANDVPW